MIFTVFVFRVFFGVLFKTSYFFTYPRFNQAREISCWEFRHGLDIGFPYGNSFDNGRWAERG